MSRWRVARHTAASPRKKGTWAEPAFCSCSFSSAASASSLVISCAAASRCAALCSAEALACCAFCLSSYTAASRLSTS